jgi:hypothetical protein
VNRDDLERLVDEQLLVHRATGVPDYEHLQLVVPGGARARALSMAPVASHAKLLTPNGVLPLKYIASGSYSDIYRAGRRGPVLAFEEKGATGKQMTMRAHRELPGNPHLPAIERLGATPEDEVYVMPFYDAPLDRRHGRAYEDAQELYGCFQPTYARRHSNEERLARRKATVDCVWRSPVTPAVAEALDVLALEMAPTNSFDFGPQNLATDAAENLVLLDVVF